MSAAWTAYRYGSPVKKPSTTRVLRGEQRKAVVDHVAALLGAFRLTPFEHEGAVRAGLRSGFCLNGNRWALADVEADEIVQEGLRRIGVTKRPTLLEGQPEVTDPNVFCKWCGDELTEDAFDGNRSGIFCSDVCGAAAFEHRRTRDNWRESAVSRKAYRAALKKQKPTRTCRQCGTLFHPIRLADDKNVFCSPACRGESLVSVPLRPCIECGIEFRPQSTKIPGNFCSNRCRHAHEKRKPYTLTCGWCGEPFQAATERAGFCRKSHALAAWKVTERIKAAELAGLPFEPRGPNRHIAQRIFDERNAALEKIDTAPPHPIHRLFDQSPEIQAPRILTAAVFDGFFLMEIGRAHV
jgi:hypothetical protein